MAAPVEPTPWDDDWPDTRPDALLEAQLAAYDAALRDPGQFGQFGEAGEFGEAGQFGEAGGGWIDDELNALIDAELDRTSTPQPVDWTVPGMPAGQHGGGQHGGGQDGGGQDGGGQDGLSARSRAVLAETAAAWRQLRHAQARCYRALATVQAGEALGESGYRSLPRLLEDQVRIDTAEAARLARHARALTPVVSPTGTVVPAALPATAGQVSAGVIGPAHVEVIRRTMTRLGALAPPLGADILATTETELAELAAGRSPAALAEAATAILALLDPDGTAPDDTPPPENELHYLRRRSGALVGRFTYRDPAAAETLHTALAAATPPPEQIPDPTPAQRAGTAPHGYTRDAEAARTLPERRAHALLDLAGEALTRGLNTPDEDTPDKDTPEDEETGNTGLFPDDPNHSESTDEPGDPDASTSHESDPDGTGDTETHSGERGGETGGEPGEGDADAPASDPPAPPAWTRADLEGGERVALTVTLNYDTLRNALTEYHHNPGDGATGRLGLLSENTWVRPETARRLACDAEIIPLVLGTTGEPLDLGRKKRLVTPALRRAVIHRDRHCAHPGCRRRARRCQVHHIVHWAQGGDTCLTNCVLLCRYHHSLAHHSDWQIHLVDGLPWFTPPAYIDPQRRPRHNRPWHHLTHPPAT